MTPIRFRRSVPDDKVVDRGFDMLMKAQRPVIIAGNGCIRRSASKQLRIFCEQTGIGVVSTFMAKGCVDMDADYCLFTVGLGSGDRASKVIDDADLVITLGFDMVEYHPRLWNPAADKTIVHADFLPAEIDEQLSDPTVEERNRSAAHKAAPFLTSTVEASAPHHAVPRSRLAPERVARRDDPIGSLTHGLRAPPA